MPSADFAALVEDIRVHGVKIPILVHGGHILDGRHRYLACRELGIRCPAIEWNGRDPWFELQSRNLLRRHLAKDQIYAIRRLAAEQFPELAASIEVAKFDASQRKLRPKAGLAERKVSHGHLTVTENRLKSSGDRSACRGPLSSVSSGLLVFHRNCSGR